MRIAVMYVDSGVADVIIGDIAYIPNRVIEKEDFNNIIIEDFIGEISDRYIKAWVSDMLELYGYDDAFVFDFTDK